MKVQIAYHRRVSIILLLSGPLISAPLFLQMHSAPVTQNLIIKLEGDKVFFPSITLYLLFPWIASPLLYLKYPKA